MGRRNRKQKSLAQFETDALECRTSPILGRHLVAKRLISKGEIMLKESPIVAGPCLSSFYPVCIGCHTEFSKNSSAPQKCQGCGWDICSDICSKKSPFHTKEECNFFREHNLNPLTTSVSDYGVITVLRCLLLKLKYPEIWKSLMSLQSVNDEKKEDTIISHLIRTEWKLSPFIQFDEIRKIRGILEVNSFEMGDGSSFGGIFLKSSMIAHDCVPNSAQNENIDDICLEVNAITDISAGTVITLCYEGSFLGTRWRQKAIEKSKYFLCSCLRCLDPTELGTHFSTLLCPKCSKGLMTSQTFKDESVWQCSNCPSILSITAVDSLIAEHREVQKKMDGKVETSENFLKKLKSIFHENHFIPFQLKFNLSLTYGHADGFHLSALSGEQLGRKMDLCRSVLSVLEVLCPGQSVPRGNILYELQASQVAIVNHSFQNDKCSRRLLRTKLQIARKTLIEAIHIFEIHYPLRLLGKRGKEITLVELNDFIKRL